MNPNFFEVLQANLRGYLFLTCFMMQFINLSGTPIPRKGIQEKCFGVIHCVKTEISIR